MNESGMPAGRPGSNSNAGDEQRLDTLFGAYRSACEPREAGVNFMPELWQKIEKAQNSAFWFRRIARGFVTAAVAMSLALAAFGLLPAPPRAPISYVDALSAHNEALDARQVSDSVEYAQDLIHLESSEEPASEI